ncbi:serine hydrolase [Streptomyces sp. NBC_01187]|uniref:serine hydrolase n=1 Tax=Streptomyces sp. NBC_01187 TaxID=2903766 RepID=UPI003864F867|nr:serine hydrolase [Streptomyces sp. NBC_01187]
MRRLLPVLAALALSAAGPATAPASPARQEQPPKTPVGKQVSWLLDASKRLPVPEAEVREHVSAALLEKLGGVDGFNAELGKAAGPDGLRLDSFRSQRTPRDSSEAYALLDGEDGRHHAVVVTGEQDDLAALHLTALPGSWSELDERLRKVAPDVSFLAAEVNKQGRCRTLHGLAPKTPRPIGSAFKLYVLGALAKAVREGRASWDQRLPVREEWKSVGGGPVSELAAGTKLTLRQYADHMIFYSDNSATDHLMHRIGRKAVEAQQTAFGMADPRANRPLLLTRELAQLKSADYPRHADAYTAMGEQDRRRYLTDEVSKLPVPGSTWEQPRHINSVEWFARPDDICRAFSGLRDQAGSGGQKPVDTSLSLMGTRTLGLDTDAWPTGWFKGGSEPGVISRNFMVESASGNTYVVSMSVSDPKENVSNSDKAAELLALSAGAFELADKAAG